MFVPLARVGKIKYAGEAGVQSWHVWHKRRHRGCQSNRRAICWRPKISEMGTNATGSPRRARVREEGRGENAARRRTTLGTRPDGAVGRGCDHGCRHVCRIRLTAEPVQDVNRQPRLVFLGVSQSPSPRELPAWQDANNRGCRPESSWVVDDHCLGPAKTVQNATLRATASGLGLREAEARGRDWLLIADSPGSCRSIIRFQHADQQGHLIGTASVSSGESREPRCSVGLLRPSAPPPS